MAMIRFENISKRFGGVQALTEVSFEIQKGSVHALLGENGAGKSTLMNILSGVISQDEGKVVYKDNEVKIGTPHAARSLGIATVFQELKNCDNLNVTENIFLGRELKKKSGGLDWKAMNERANEILKTFEIEIDIRQPLKKLTVAQKQMIEIAKAIDLDADVLILDEPTSALTINETKKLFKNIQRLKEKGVCIIYISHRMEEIFEVADEISMMRNGKFLGTYAANDITTEEIIKMIAGKELMNEYSGAVNKEKKDFSNVVLSTEQLSSAPEVKNVSFELREGEILGFYGLQGSGRTETMETIFGLRKKTDGTLRVYGEIVNAGKPKKSIDQNIGMLTEDRKLTGCFFNMDLNDNIAIIHSKDIAKGGLIDTRKAGKMTRDYIDRLSIKCSGIHQMIGNLSGGNQQKVVLSRCLSTNPKILILDEPTRGVDVGAKAEIYDILKRLRDEENKSMIVVSSELPEIILLCDRVIVMHGGTVVGELSGDEINEEKILQCAFNENKKEAI